MSTPFDSAFLSRTELLLGRPAVAAFAQTHVVVVGVGGVGGWCAEALVRSGLGHLVIVDDDSVSPSNLNRQLPATTHTLGRPKVAALAERLLSINPALDLVARATRYTPETAADFDAFFTPSAETAPVFVVDAIDSVPCKAALIRHVAGSPATLFSSMGAGARIDPSRIKATSFKKVQGDGLARALRQRFKRDGLFPARDFTCVWSDEPARNRGERRPADGLANGSCMPVTASFGLRLAALVLAAAAHGRL